MIDLDELKTEGILAIARNMRIGHYALEANDEILMLRKQNADYHAVLKEFIRLACSSAVADQDWDSQINKAEQLLSQE